MLEVQKYLQSESKSFTTLTEELGILVKYHDSLPIAICDYSQINSPRNNSVVMECRGLVLETFPPYRIVSKAFNRFWNMGEYSGEEENFDWESFQAFEKLDGSLIQLFYYDNRWLVKTRASWASGVCNELIGKTWSELFWEVVSLHKVQEVCEKSKTYVFEYCSLWNQVVVRHDEPKAYLLAIYEGETEVDQQESCIVAEGLRVPRPKIFDLHTLKDLEDFLQKMYSDGKLDEGFVIRDSAGIRWKMKNPGYLAMHRLHNNGQCANIKHVVPLILMGETEEVLSGFPQYKPIFDEAKAKIDEAYAQLEKVWEECKNIEDQKMFAQAIVPQTKFSSVLFRARRDEGSIRDIWLKSSDLILKVLFDRKEVSST